MINNFGLQFHHMGLAVNNEADAITFLTNIGCKVGELVYDPEQNVHLRFCTSDFHPSVELVMPGKGKGPLDSILKRSGEMIYHTCYQVADLEQTLFKFEDAGLRVITVSGPKPALLFDGKRVSFYKIFGFGLIELLELTN